MCVVSGRLGDRRVVDDLDGFRCVCSGSAVAMLVDEYADFGKQLSRVMVGSSGHREIPAAV